MPGLFERIVLNPMNKILRYIKAVKLRHLLSLGISRAAATAPLRNLDPCDPSTWEFRGLSQHGEDGIIEYLTAKLARPNRYFVEIGIGDGTENNTSWLAVAKCWRGLMVDGNALNLEWARYLLQPLNYGVAFRSSFVTVEGIQTVIDGIAQQDPDFFSLDIDGNDYWVAKALLKAGIRPKIWCVEYNSARPSCNNSVSAKLRSEERTRPKPIFRLFDCGLEGVNGRERLPLHNGGIMWRKRFLRSSRGIF
jgi:hypothetical protein